jgi:hypothetical protein
MAQDYDLSSIIPSIKVHPFPSFIDRTDSGIILDKISKTPIYNREALLECPTCLAIDDFYSRKKTGKFQSVYCAGNQPAEIERVGIFGDKHKHVAVCAGVMVAHFHVSCECCGKKFLLAIPDKK